jgi:HSP20 family protein
MYLTTRSYALREPFNRLFSDVLGFAEWPFRNGATTAWVPSVDVVEEKDGIRILAELPGVKSEDVKISVEDHLLSISGTKQQGAEEHTERVHRYERTYGTFARTFSLPATVDADAIKATYVNGVLTVTLPKVEKAKPREIPVEALKS